MYASGLPPEDLANTLTHTHPQGHVCKPLAGETAEAQLRLKLKCDGVYYANETAGHEWPRVDLCGLRNGPNIQSKTHKHTHTHVQKRLGIDLRLQFKLITSSPQHLVAQLTDLCAIPPFKCNTFALFCCRYATECANVPSNTHARSKCHSYSSPTRMHCHIPRQPAAGSHSHFVMYTHLIRLFSIQRVRSELFCETRVQHRRRTHARTPSKCHSHIPHTYSRTTRTHTRTQQDHHRTCSVSPTAKPKYRT